MLEPLSKVATLLSGSNIRLLMVGPGDLAASMCPQRSPFQVPIGTRFRTCPPCSQFLFGSNLGDFVFTKCPNLGLNPGPYDEGSIVGTTEQSGHFAQRFQQLDFAILILVTVSNRT